MAEKNLAKKSAMSGRAQDCDVSSAKPGTGC